MTSATALTPRKSVFQLKLLLAPAFSFASFCFLKSVLDAGSESASESLGLAGSRCSSLPMKVEPSRAEKAVTACSGIMKVTKAKTIPATGT